MKIATFNINGIKARIGALTDWLEDAKPDVAILQEIKSVDEGFPRETFEDMGYIVETHGQKGFNGVAILSKLPLEDVTRGLPGAAGAGRDGVDDEEARYIEATVMGDKPIRICGLYLPNGNPAPGPKYDYKLRWMERLHARAKEPHPKPWFHRSLPNARNRRWALFLLGLPSWRLGQKRRYSHRPLLADPAMRGPFDQLLDRI